MKEDGWRSLGFQHFCCDSLSTGLPMPQATSGQLHGLLPHGHAVPARSQGLSLAVSCCVGASGAYTEIKKVAEEKVVLPCHHQLGLQEKGALDIEWLLTDSKGNQKAVSAA